MSLCLGSMSVFADARWNDCRHTVSENIGAFGRPTFGRGSSVSGLERASMLDASVTIIVDAERGGRVSRKERMTRPRYQERCGWFAGERTFCNPMARCEGYSAPKPWGRSARSPGSRHERSCKTKQPSLIYASADLAQPWHSKSSLERNGGPMSRWR